jgi:DNA modification methylase
MIQEYSKTILSEPRGNTVLQGDCIEVRRRFRSRSVDFVLADPPYLAH